MAAFGTGEGGLPYGRGGGEHVGEAVFAEAVTALQQERRAGVVVVGSPAD